jgi:hypothetical protein
VRPDLTLRDDEPQKCANGTLGSVQKRSEPNAVGKSSIDSLEDSTARVGSAAHQQPHTTIPWSGRFYRFFVAVVTIQGIHVVEHIVQLIQVYVFHIDSEKAFGILGYVFNVMGTAEWMHLVFNAAYLAALYVVAYAGYQLLTAGAITRRVYITFVALGTGLESWHLVEHFVIISNVLRNNGCPCPGIGDRVLHVSDVQLHFVYNALTYGATFALFRAVRRSRRSFVVAN